jgi:hypothetical protein
MTIAEATEMIAHWRSKQQSVEEFCKEYGVCQSSFYRWRHRLAAEENRDKQMFVPVQIIKDNNGSTLHNSVFEFTYPNGVRLNVSGACDMSILRQLIQF